MTNYNPLVTFLSSHHTHFAPASLLQEREELGRLLLEVSVDWKRLLSPMLTYAVCQEALVIVYREVAIKLATGTTAGDEAAAQGEPGPGARSLRPALTFERKETFSGLLERLKATPEAQRNKKLRQRHDPWVDAVRDQVTIALLSSSLALPGLLTLVMRGLAAADCDLTGPMPGLGLGLGTLTLGLMPGGCDAVRCHETSGEYRRAGGDARAGEQDARGWQRVFPGRRLSHGGGALRPSGAAAGGDHRLGSLGRRGTACPSAHGEAQPQPGLPQDLGVGQGLPRRHRGEQRDKA